MHTCPNCGQECDCSGDIDDTHVMKESWVFLNCTCCDGRDFDEDTDDDEVIGYYCLGCGHQQDHGGQCDACTGYSMDEIYF